MTQLNTFGSRCPIIRREVVPFARWISRDGIEPARHLLTFEREVLWLVETSSTARHAIGDRVLGKAGATHNDFYGLLSSATDIIAEAKERAALEGLEPFDRTRIEVVTTRIEQPVIAIDPADALRRKSFAHLPSDWLVDDEALALWRAAYLLPLDQRPDDLPPVTRLRESSQDFTVWRSDWTDQANADAFALARAAIVPTEEAKTEEIAHG